MAYLSTEQLKSMGFKSLGKNVKISDKASIYNADQIEIGDHSRIDDFCVVSGVVSIGRFVHIAPFCLMAGGTDGICMADFSACAYGGKVFSQTDDYSGMAMISPLVPSDLTSVTKGRVEINRHVIIGTGSVVFPGVSIAEGCAIGAMTLVRKSTAPWGIYTGIPAKRVKERHKNVLTLERQLLTRYPEYDPLTPTQE